MVILIYPEWTHETFTGLSSTLSLRRFSSHTYRRFSFHTYIRHRVPAIASHIHRRQVNEIESVRLWKWRRITNVYAFNVFVLLLLLHICMSLCALRDCACVSWLRRMESNWKHTKKSEFLSPLNVCYIDSRWFFLCENISNDKPHKWTVKQQWTWNFKPNHYGMVCVCMSLSVHCIKYWFVYQTQTGSSIHAIWSCWRFSVHKSWFLLVVRPPANTYTFCVYFRMYTSYNHYHDNVNVFSYFFSRCSKFMTHFSSIYFSLNYFSSKLFFELFFDLFF